MVFYTSLRLSETGNISIDLLTKIFIFFTVERVVQFDSLPKVLSKLFSQRVGLNGFCFLNPAFLQNSKIWRTL